MKKKTKRKNGATNKSISMKKAGAVRKPTARKTAPKKPTVKKPAVKKPAKKHVEQAPRAPGEKRYWLLKQEPTDFSFDDLWARADRTTNWEGVRNFRARNFLRDEITQGDLAFFYHSNAKPSAVVGVVEIVRSGYPDLTAFDSTSDYYDADSTPDAPRWFQVDVRAVERFANPVSLEDIKQVRALENMMLLRISQLSVQAVTRAEWDVITKLARATR